jgi:hypothetical protein
MNRRTALTAIAAAPLVGLVPQKVVDCHGIDEGGNQCSCFNKTDAICPRHPSAFLKSLPLPANRGFIKAPKDRTMDGISWKVHGSPCWFDMHQGTGTHCLISRH